MDRRLRRKLMHRVIADARVIAGHFGLEYRAIEPERANVKSRYGICYDDGTIKIRLTHAVNGRPLKYSSIVNTLCHELAHLRHFDHGPQFRSFYAELLAWARQRGIYRPGRTRGDATGIRPEPSPQMAMDLGTAIRTGRLPSLRESLAGVLGPRPGQEPPLLEPRGCGAPVDAPTPFRRTPAPVGRSEAPRPPNRQLDLFS